MTKDFTISIRLDAEQEQAVRRLSEATGWSIGELIRQMIDNAMVKPAAIATIIHRKDTEKERA